MLQNIFKRSMVAVAALLMMVTSCTKDEKEPELTPQQKAEAVVKDIKKGANTDVMTTMSTTDLDAQKQGIEGAVQTEKVKASVSVDTSVENATPLVTLYLGYSDETSVKYGETNEDEIFVKFVPEVKVSGDIVKVSSKEVKEFSEYSTGTIMQGKGEGNKFTDVSGAVRVYKNVSFEYNKKTNTINNVSVTHSTEGSGFTFNTKIELKNLPLDSSKEVVAYGETQYKREERGRKPSLTARPNTSTVLSGVKPVHIKIEGIDFFGIQAENNFKPVGYHYAKFTPLADGRIQMELCNANGETNGGDPKVDNQTGFATERMPMRLYFLDVKIRNNNGVITDAQGGHNYVKAMRRKEDVPGFFAWIFKKVNPNGQESKKAEILTTTLGQSSQHDILMNPHLPADVRIHITIN